MPANRRADAELLASWRAGDRTAGHALFRRYGKSIVRFFENKVRGDHEDLVQATFMACLLGRDRIRDPSRFRGYLFGAAYRTLHEHYRRGYGGLDVTQRSIASMCDPGPSPVSVRARDEARQRVQAALRELPLELQTIMELYYWEDLTATEIATALELAEGTVRSRIRRGLLRLTAVLCRVEGSPLRQLEHCAMTLRGASASR